MVDVLAPTFLFPASLGSKEIVKESVKRLDLPDSKTLKLFYLIDSETREQQNHRMALLVQESKFSLPYVEELAQENDLLRDRLGTALDACSTNQDALYVTRAELELERKKRKAAEARVKELERLLIVQKRGTV